jgi:hypothetical protein
VLCAGLIPVLFATAQAPPAPAAAPPPAGRAGAPGFKNLKVLPDTITQNQLRDLMHEYTGDLGVECEFCHAPRDPVTKRSDRASDANPVKETARFMIQMTDDLNTKYLAAMPDRRYADPITCGTCHRGEKHPSIFVPPPRAPGNGPGAAPPGAAPPTGTPPAPRPGY